ncbi:MAG: preprotein translocase subunit SecE [Solirubrobacteraceae bacterium]
MARNRKRAKERQARRAPGASAGVATARAQRERVEAQRSRSDPLELGPLEAVEGVEAAEAEPSSPDPIEHATPGVELAEAQLAVGRPELADDPQLGAAELEDAELASEAARDHDDGDQSVPRDEGDADLKPEPSSGGGGGGRRRGRSGAGFDGGGTGPPGGEGGAELALPGPSVPERRAHPGNRLITFIQGSWRELQRVQWPDRRQVMQATGVVIGFVIVAGVFLGVADVIATKLVNLILK